MGNWEATLEGVYTREGMHVRGYFKAPRTGSYKFWVAGDDQVEVYLNTTP